MKKAKKTKNAIILCSVSFSYKENLGKELTFQKLKISGTFKSSNLKFLKKVKSKTIA